ncbi:MAG: hypothetical protein ACYC7A_12945 [Thermoanaerobaculia bacterium]
MSEMQPVKFSEAGVPLDSIAASALELIEIFGGTVVSQEARRIRFTMPNRRGVAASGDIRVEVSWPDESAGTGTVNVDASAEVEAPRFQQIALLGLGSVGAILFLLWPFFPQISELAAIGALFAIAAYFLTLKTTRKGVVQGFLHELVRAQHENAERDDVSS